MTDWLLLNSNVANVTLGEPLTAYLAPNGGFVALTNTEVRSQSKVRDTYTAKNLWCNVVANGITGTTVVRTRKNTADGAQSLSIGSSATGTFEDTTNTDSLVTGDLFNYSITTPSVGGTPTITIRPISVILSHADNVALSAATINATSTITADNYFPIAGYPVEAPAEATRQITARTAGVLSQMRVYIAANTTTAATWRSRINGANGAQSVSVTSGATGEFVDTTNSDTVAVGDEMTTLCDITSGSSLGYTILEYECVGFLRSSAVANTTTGAAYTNLSYASLNGRFAANLDTVEANVRVKARCTTKFRNLFTYIYANIAVASVTIGLRNNGSTVISVSIGAGATGIFEETATTVTPATTDLLNYIIDASAAVSAITPSLISIEQIPIYLLNVGGSIAPSGNLIRQAQIVKSGSLPMAGTLNRQANKLFAGGITPTSNLIRLVNKNFGGGITPTGALTLARIIALLVAGSITPTGILVRQVNKLYSGQITPTGNLIRQANKNYSGSIALAGTLTRIANKVYAGTVGLAGSLIKQITTAYAGQLTPTGEVDNTVATRFSGNITPTGTLSRQVNKLFGGTVAPVGILIKLVNKLFSGDITPTGTLTNLKVAVLFVAGSITPVGALVKVVQKTYAGSIALAGTLTKQVSTIYSGTLPLSGALTKVANKLFDGNIAPSGILTNVKTAFVSAIGSIIPTGNLTKQVNKLFSGSITPSGILSNVKNAVLSVGGSITPDGNLIKQVNKIFAGSITPSGLLSNVKTATLFLAGSITPIGTLTKVVNKIYSGTIGLSGNLIKLIHKIFTGNITPGGSLSNVFIPPFPTTGEIKATFKAMFKRMFKRMQQ